MPFIENNFSPMGANARAGNAPQVFSYISEDNRVVAMAPSYFDEIKGLLFRGDWVNIIKDVDTTIGLSFNFILGDGSTPSAMAAAIVAGGTDYAVGNLLEVTYTDGTLLQKTILRVVTVSSGVVTGIEIEDPGLFDAGDPATSLTALATVALTGSGNDDFTADITLAGAETDNGIVTMSEKEIVAA